jgi:hypothetical protein
MYKADDGPLTQSETDELRHLAGCALPNGKVVSKASLFPVAPSAGCSDETVARVKGAKAVTPTPDDLRFAAEWMRQYDDSHDGGKQTAVAEALAEWLDAQADAKELRAAAREHKVPVKGLRAALAKAP